MIERERLRQLRLHARKAVCARLTAAGRPGEAVDLGLAAVAGDPLRESAHRALIQAHLAEGNRADAVRQYQAYREILRDALGVSPSARLKALMTDGLADPPPDVVADRALWGRHTLRAKDGAVTPAYPDARCRPRVDEEEAR